jgi:hypothetical protein
MSTTTYALSRHVPDMERGFTIHTNYGDLEIHQDEVAPFIDALTRCLIKRLEKERKEATT